MVEARAMRVFAGAGASAVAWWMNQPYLHFVVCSSVVRSSQVYACPGAALCAMSELRHVELLCAL